MGQSTLPTLALLQFLCVISATVKSVDFPGRLNLKVTGPVAVLPEARAGPASATVASIEAVMATPGASVIMPSITGIHRSFLSADESVKLER